MPFGIDRESLGEGVVTAASAGAVLGGPLGALLGAGVGLLRGATRRNELDLLAAEAQLSAATEARLVESLALAGSEFTNPIDQKQARVMASEIAALRAGTLSGDANIRQQSQSALLGYFGTINDELERVQDRTFSNLDYERDRINLLADDTRAQYEGALAAAQSAEATGASIHQILASDIPTDSPLFAGSIISLLQQSQRNMLVDPYGTSEYIQDTVGRLPIAGGILGAWLGGKAELAENQFSREDFRQIADAFLVAGKRAQEGAMRQAAQRGAMLGEAAQRIGYDPAVPLQAQIVTGKVERVGGVGGPGQYQDVEVRPLEGNPGWGAAGENVVDPIVEGLGSAASQTVDAFRTAGRAVMGAPAMARQGAADAYQRVVDFITPYAKPLVEGVPDQTFPTQRGRIDRTRRGTDREMNR